MNIKKIIALLLALALLPVLAACGKKTEEAPAPSQEEESQEEPEFEEYPVRIGDYTVSARPGVMVSLAPSLTEKLGDLDLEGRLAGVSDYCDYPPAIDGLPRCGTAQLPDVQAIIDTGAHLVLAEAPLPDSAMEQLEEANIEVVVINRPTGIAGWKESYHSLLRIAEGQHTGGALGDNFTGSLEYKLDQLSGRYGSYADMEGRKKALYLRMLDFNVATGDTLDHALLELIGLENIAAGYTGWHMSAEQAQEARSAFEALDIIYCDESAEDGVTITMLEQSAFYRGLGAVLQDRYLYIDSIVFERQGMRMLEQLEKMAAYAYPDAAPAGQQAEQEDALEE